MPLFLITIILFLLWFRVKMKKSKSNISTNDELFWERENKANHKRKADISNLPLFIPDYSILPFGVSSSERSIDAENNIKKYSTTKMMNLSKYSNTDLKEKYGVANLDILSQYDSNFTKFIRDLCSWGKILFEENFLEESKQIMEYSIKIGSDISTAYIILGKIYAMENNYQKIDELISMAERTDSLLKDSTVKKLMLQKLE